MMRALLSLALLAGCFIDLRMGGSAPVGHGHGGSSGDIGFGFGGEHRGERIRAGGGLHVGVHGYDDKKRANGFAQLGAMGRIDVGLTNPNELGGRIVATAQLAVGLANGFSEAGGIDDESAPDGTYTQMFLGIGIGATRSDERRERRKMDVRHITLGLLATRFFPFRDPFRDQGDSYWLIGAALSFSFGLNLDVVSDAFSGDDE